MGGWGLSGLFPDVPDREFLQMSHHVGYVFLYRVSETTEKLQFFFNFVSQIFNNSHEYFHSTTELLVTNFEWTERFPQIKS